jgi:hypothetical protein
MVVAAGWAVYFKVLIFSYPLYNFGCQLKRFPNLRISYRGPETLCLGQFSPGRELRVYLVNLGEGKGD